MTPKTKVTPPQQSEPQEQQSAEGIVKALAIDRLEKIEVLNGYLKMWQKSTVRPFELDSLIEELDEYINTTEIL